MKDAGKTFLGSLLALAVLVLLWGWATRRGGLAKSVLPSPADVAGALQAGLVQGTLHAHILATGRAALAGLAAGMLLGIAAGALVVLVPVLELFVRHPNRVLSREEIAQHVWPFDFTAMSNVIDVYVGCLRRKLGDVDEPRLLTTVRGVGYLLRDGKPR